MMKREECEPSLLSAFDLVLKQEYKDAIDILNPFIQSNASHISGQAQLLSAFCALNLQDDKLICEVIKCPDEINRKEVLAIYAIGCAGLGNSETAEKYNTKAMKLEMGKYGYYTYDLLWQYVLALSRGKLFEFIPKYIRIFVKAYSGYHITDTTFLALREVPPFTYFLDSVIDWVKQNQIVLHEEDWSELMNSVDENGKNNLVLLFQLCGFKS